MGSGTPGIILPDVPQPTPMDDGRQTRGPSTFRVIFLPGDTVHTCKATEAVPVRPEQLSKATRGRLQALYRWQVSPPPPSPFAVPPAILDRRIKEAVLGSLGTQDPGKPRTLNPGNARLSSGKSGGCKAASDWPRAVVR